MDARAERALLRQCQQDDRESRWRPAPAHDAELKAEAEAEAVTTDGQTGRRRLSKPSTSSELISGDKDDEV